MSGWELEHSPAAEDVTTMALLVVFQFEVYPACLTKGLIDLKSQVASITYNQVRLITLKFPSSSSSSSSSSFLLVNLPIILLQS